jgi:toxin-antitoxin system PIN domain toxin
MKYLLDVNVLLAAIWAKHPQHSRAFDWLADKTIVLCPLAELGFLRISTNKKVSINVPMEHARNALSKFAKERNAGWIHDDLEPLDSSPRDSDQVTDQYLADLAAKHGARLATFDQRIKHRAIEAIV